jgi:DNA-binding beta-propeller fold protein YncE
MRRSVLTVSALLVGAVLVAGKDAAPAKRRVLPGLQATGFVQLPNQWSLRPAGKQVRLGDFPVNMALHPGGRWLAVLHAGHSDHEIMTLDLKTQKVVSRVLLDQTWYGLCFAPDGKKLYASGAEFEVVHAYKFEGGLLSRHREIPVARPRDKFVPGGLAVSEDGKTLFAAGTWGGAVCIVPVKKPEKRKTVSLGKDSYPYACLPEPESSEPARKDRPVRLFVSLWNKAAVAVVDVKQEKVLATWPTEKHPTEMALSPDGKALFVACANSTKVSVLDTTTGQGQQTIACALYPLAPNGNTPNSLSLTPDGQLLFVANADANNVAVFNVADPGNAKPLGFIPAGWYPTSVRYNPRDKRLYVANGKGTTPLANPQGPNPYSSRQYNVREYIARLFRGSLSVLDLPDEKRMPALTRQAYACSPLKADASVTGKAPRGNPVPAKVGDPSPIKHVIYVIKENRTYDQVFGDMKEGNGDPNLCLFPEKVTPNHHKLAREFVLLDNFYCDGEVSADGHEWSMGAYCTDFVEKAWPLVYRGSPKKKLGYPAEGAQDAIARPAGGYLWDRCAEAKVSYRSYGEWIQNGKTLKDPGKASVKALEGHFDPWFRGYDLNYPDQKRADRFIAELKRFEKEGGMPRLNIVRLPNNHTWGTRVGKPTPTAYVADNDLALGRLVEAVSNSKFWKDTAIFVVEDDAQNGPDHVDAHRTVALVISPYTKRKHVDSTLYSTSSMLRTMELILGLKPMSQFDAAARPMYHSFQARPDLTPYKHAVPQTDMKAKNKTTDFGARRSAKLDFSKEDAVDDFVLNEIIWKSVRGANSPVPAPVRAAFVFPHLKEEKEEK